MGKIKEEKGKKTLRSKIKGKRIWRKRRKWKRRTTD
jgi:hypothetical protein